MLISIRSESVLWSSVWPGVPEEVGCGVKPEENGKKYYLVGWFWHTSLCHWEKFRVSVSETVCSLEKKNIPQKKAY